jgi:hypothetical protein
MKAKLLALALAAGFSGGAAAAPFSLPAGPIYFQFTNLEQADIRTDPVTGAPLNNTATCAGCSGVEGNWGIAQVSIMRKGKVSPTGSVAGQIDNDIDNAGLVPFFSDQLLPAGAQVTAIFYDIQQTSVTTSGSVISLKSTGGFIDFYYDEASRPGSTIVAIGDATPAERTSNSTFTGFTDGAFLGRLAFASGINKTDASVTIQGTIDTALSNNSGSADSYANVVDVNGDGVIDSGDGVWAGQLNTDYFGTVYGTRDVRFSNKIDVNTSWNGTPGVLGLTSNDPGRAMVVPEPATLALLGLGLLGVGATSRRRKAS